MGKTALLVSREEMLYQAHNILQEKKFQIQEMRVIRTSDSVMEARQSIADGASIIIARGLQASLIKQYTEIPVVEIMLTAQEMALLVMRAKQIVKKPRPVIAVVGFDNMFCDMSYFDELYEIELRTYYAKQGSELPGVVQKAIEDDVDLIIGGDTAVAAATEAGVPSLFLSMTEDSMRQAFSMAERVEYAMNVEKKSAAQMEALTDYSFSGVIRLDSEGKITAANPMMEDITGRSQTELKGQNIRKIAPQIGEEALNQVLKVGKEYSLFLEWNQVPVFAVLAPVLYEERVDGAIITCHKMKKKTAGSERDRNDKNRGDKGRRDKNQALPPLVRFEDILQKSPSMQECIRLARLYAMSEHPVVLMGEPGTEKRMLAESIHNSSSRGNGPFLDVPCDGLSEEDQRNMIFGERGAALQAQGGSLLIQDVEELTAANQYRLYQLIRFRVCHGADIARLRKVDVRVMVTVRKPLAQLMWEKKLREDLYYLLSGLELLVPPLRERKEDLEQEIDLVLHDCCDRYSRYHVLTNGAKEILMEHSWPGNLFQIESFCERLILTAGKRSIDEIVVRKLLEDLYPEEQGGLVSAASSTAARAKEVSEQFPGQSSEQARKIIELLARFDGSREKTAKELGISKATLWRHMKKYGIETKKQ